MVGSKSKKNLFLLNNHRTNISTQTKNQEQVIMERIEEKEMKNISLMDRITEISEEILLMIINLFLQIKEISRQILLD
jgi:hypothetical protein